MNQLLDAKELNKLSSTDGIIELLCGIPNFKSDDYDELNIETRDLIDYTMSIKLLSDSQINGNLRRSMDAGNLALINQRKLTAISLLYFGIKDENGKYVKYICPYTGKEYDLEEVRRELNKTYNTRDLDKVLELEHIMPHSSGGGTVLFNCIPASKEANSVAEKGNLHLLDWLANPESSGYKYYENGGIERLNKLVNYMLSAYEISFEKYEESELEFNYDNTGEIEEGIDNEEDIESNDRKVANSKKKIRETSVDGDIPFLNQLINQLEKEGYETKDIKNKLLELEEKGIINNLQKYTKVQKTIEELFEKEDSKSYLTYSLNVDYIKLVNSIEADEPEEIKKTLTKRFKQIKQLTETNGKSIKDYFISLKDIQEIDLLYREEISENDIEIFINNIKLGHEGKIDLFIEMLSDNEYTKYEKGKGADNNIFVSKNKVPFKGYEKIEGLTTSQFWSHKTNRDKIKSRIEESIKELTNKESLTKDGQRKVEQLKKAKRAIDCYEFTNRIDRRMDCYIEMLANEEYTGYEKGNPNSNNILGVGNNILFKGYEDIEGLNTSHFWRGHSTEIKARIEEKTKKLNSEKKLTKEEQIELKNLQKAEKAIDCYEFALQGNIDRRINCFIEMLAEDEFTKYENGNPNEKNIFVHENKIPFKGYENIEGLNTSSFWGTNSYKIKGRIEEETKKLISKGSLTEEEQIKLEKLQKAEKAIDCYEFALQGNSDRRIDCFIEMLAENEFTKYENGNPNEKNVFGRNNVPFKGYEKIEGLTTSQFWSHKTNRDKTKATIEERIKELTNKESLTKNEQRKLEQLKKAKRAIDCYEFQAKNEDGINRRIDCFIEMLTNEEYTGYKKGNPNSNNILGVENNILFKGYEDIEGLNTSHFWSDHSTEIKTRIEEKTKELNSKERLTKEEQIELKKLQKAEKAIDCYEFQAKNEDGINRRIDCFIEMLAEDKYTQYEKRNGNINNIFVRENKIPFKGYENMEGLNTSCFWGTNSDKIKGRIEEKTKKLISKGNLTEEEQIKLEKLQKAEKAIDCYEFALQGNLNRRIDCFVEMLADDEYTGYEYSSRDKNNIFIKRNAVPFKGYENIDGLNTSEFWSKNSIKIISRLFYNTDDKGNKLEKDYSGNEYDKARNAILKYAKVKSIEEYIDKLKNVKKRNTLINLRENASKLTMSEVEGAGKIIRGILNKDKEIA